MVNSPVPSLRRQQQPTAQPAPQGEQQCRQQPPPPRQQRPPTPGQLRPERRALVHSREDLIRDLDGLLLEKYKRQHFSKNLATEHFAEFISMEDRIRDD